MDDSLCSGILEKCLILTGSHLEPREAWGLEVVRTREREGHVRAQDTEPRVQGQYQCMLGSSFGKRVSFFWLSGRCLMSQKYTLGMDRVMGSAEAGDPLPSLGACRS